MNTRKYLTIFHHLYHLYIKRKRYDERCNACFRIGLYQILDPNNPKIINYMKYEDELFKKSEKSSLKITRKKWEIPKFRMKF